MKVIDVVCVVTYLRYKCNISYNTL